jgi:hypothetical protein
MKTITALTLFVFFTGASFAQERPARLTNRKLKVTTTVNTTQTKKVDSPAVQTATGTVRDASCGAYIEVNVNGEIHRYFPVNLNPKMKIEAYTIQFDYVDDSAAFPENCEITKSVRLNNVRYVSSN